MTAALPAAAASGTAPPMAAASTLRRAAASLLSCAAAAAGVLLALHHPLSPSIGLLSIAAAALFVAWRPDAWLLFVPALLPLIGFAPWSGWLAVEELDLLVLAVAAGGWLRIALGSGGGGRGGEAPAASLRAPVAAGLLLFGLSVAISVWRGVADAGGPSFGWFQGYREPANALRLGKSFFLAALLLPLWLSARRRSAGKADTRLALGLALGLAGASLAALWERLAYTGLLDFSSDYRTTALFWEMHVGGAALDGFLALTVPFAVHLLLRARTRLQWMLASALAVLAGYACLTTFSRAVYVALPVSLTVMALLQARNARAAAGSRPAAAGVAAGSRTGLIAPLLLLVGFAVGAERIFAGSGYRGMLAWAGAVLLLLPLAEAMRGRRAVDWLLGAAGGAGLTGIAVLLGGHLPKGPYAMYCAAWLLAAAALLQSRRGGRIGAEHSPTGVIALAAGLASVGLTGAVAAHWGGERALFDALPPLAAWPFALALLARRNPAPATDARTHGALAAALFVVMLIVGVFSGGAFIGQRFHAGSDDLTARSTHWKRALDGLLTPADIAFGHGLGRFADRWFVTSPAAEQTGDWRVLHDGGENRLVLTGGKFPAAFYQLFRVTQRVAAPEGIVALRFDVRAAEPVMLHFELCEKHLLYTSRCLFRDIGVKPGGAAWRPVVTTLDGPAVGRGDAWAPRLLAFSIAVDTLGGRAEVDNLQLEDASGRRLLDNGDFSADGAHWFFSSDRIHMPWHMKNLFLHQLVEQGVVGALLLAALVAAALLRLAVGAARREPLAPPLAAALVGFLLIGVGDSLLDAPRIAFLFYLLLMAALTLPAGRPAGSTARRRRRVAAPAAAVAALFVVVGSLVPAPADAAGGEPVAAAAAASAPRLRLAVGPGREVATLAEAARRVAGAMLIEVDAGEYRGDVAVWDRGDVILRAVGGRVRLVADGAAAEGKAIWVVRNATLDVTGFDFIGARVADANGAGIRLESGRLAVHDCAFGRNENGILAGNNPETVLSVEDSEFGYNGHGDGQSHDLYAGTIASLRVTGSWFHHADRGHLLKSRAARSHVAYNLLADGVDGHASYELEFPNGGVAIVIGNLIQQAATTDNPVMISYGVEGYRWPRNELQLVNNTLVDQRPGGSTMLRVSPGNVTVRALNNLLLGNGAFDVPGTAERNHRVDAADLPPDAAGLWRLPPGSRWAGQAIDPGRAADGEPLRPAREYRHPRSTVALPAATPLQPGALQLPGVPAPRPRNASVPTADPVPSARRARQP